MSITQTLTSAPGLPDRLDKVNFSGQVATYLSWESTSRGELINWTTQANDVAAQCNANAVTSATSTAMLNSAILAVNASKWISGTTYSIGDVRWSPTTYLVYRRKTAGSGTTDPTSDSTNWQKIDALPDQTGNSGKYLKTDGTTTSWYINSIVHITSSGSWVATSTSAEVTVVGGGGGTAGTNGASGSSNGGTTSFAGPGVTISATGGMFGDASASWYRAAGVGSNGDINGKGGFSTDRAGGGTILSSYNDALIPSANLGIGGWSSYGNAGGGGHAIKVYTNLVVGTSYTCTIGAGGTAATGGSVGSSGRIIIKTL